MFCVEDLHEFGPDKVWVGLMILEGRGQATWKRILNIYIHYFFFIRPGGSGTPGPIGPLPWFVPLNTK